MNLGKSRVFIADHMRILDFTGFFKNHAEDALFYSNSVTT